MVVVVFHTVLQCGRKMADFNFHSGTGGLAIWPSFFTKATWTPWAWEDGEEKKKHIYCIILSIL